jgi:hypothetical protein
MQKALHLVIYLNMFFLLCLESSCLYSDYKGQFILINNSDKFINIVCVKICGETIEVRNIEPGAEYKGVYNVKSDSHYDVTIWFASGEKLEKKLGYVTHGFNYQHTLTITEEDISISDVKIE